MKYLSTQTIGTGSLKEPIPIVYHMGCKMAVMIIRPRQLYRETPVHLTNLIFVHLFNQISENKYRLLLDVMQQHKLLFLQKVSIAYMQII